MLNALKRLRRRENNMKEFRSLDCRLLEDIGLAGCDPSSVRDTNALLLIHRGPFDR